MTGGAFGILLAVWTTDIVPALFFEQDVERLVFAPDIVGTVVVSAVCVGITIACGLLPLVELRHDNPAAVLQRESAGPSRGVRRLRASLVVAQMACCSVLVISTGLLLSSFRAALATGVGHRLGQPILATAEARFGFDRPISASLLRRGGAGGTVGAGHLGDRMGRDAAGHAPGVDADARRATASASPRHGHGRGPVHAGVARTRELAADRGTNVRRR